jgi:hypothetical protein
VSASMFSRRHYRAVASVLGSARYLSDDDRSQLVSEFIQLFGSDNERFQPERFREAASSELSERDRLEARGYRDGHAAATWFEIPDEESARRALRMLDEGDPEIYDVLPLPRLGGEYAGEPTWSDILEDEGCEDSDDGRPELLNAYQYAYTCAVEREIVRSSRVMLDLFPHDLGTR